MQALIKDYFQIMNDKDKELIKKLREWASKTDNQPMAYKILFKTITGSFDDWENRKNYEKYIIMSKVYWHFPQLLIEENWKIKEANCLIENRNEQLIEDILF
jgi:hypothetical protein